MYQPISVVRPKRFVPGVMQFVGELGRIVHERDLNRLEQLKQENAELSPVLNNLEGLSLNEVERNRELYGRNVLPQVRQKLFLEFVWDASQDRILILLAVAAVISLAVHFRNGGWVEGVAILLAVVIVVLVNAVNDWKKDLMFRSLNQKSKEGMKAKVKRSNVSDLIPVQDLVIFDIIQLEPGNIVPADALLVRESHPIVVDESTATGESKTLTKSIENDPFFLSGTRITDGSGMALVVAIGEASFHGKLMMAMRGENEPTPLQIQLNDLADFIAKGGLSLAVLLFFALVAKHWQDADLIGQLADFLIASITIVVVAVPEGLPMAVTLALAFATNRMLKDNNLVRVLASCETMGRVTSICSDKTGTLTENRMTVVRYSFPSGDEHEKLVEIVSEGISVNSTAFEIENEAGQFEFVGSATEAAILRFIKERFKAAYSLVRLKVAISKVIPFSSARKFMITVTEGGRVHLKGAAEIVLNKCTTLMKSDGQIYEMNEEELREIRRLLNEMNGEALRTIGQAFTQITVNENINDEVLIHDLEYCWLGVYGIEDPLRSGVKEAVATCQTAGIFVRMVTGDCRATAESIARRCGILMCGGLVMEGSEFRSTPDDVLVKKLPKLQVLARSNPLDKQRLVKLLKKSLGEIVAVTGDGSNDGPALKASDVGFSMGITGTQLAQEASSIVLLDDNFASIVKAASWGRSITRSVRKFLQFQLTVNVAAVITAVVTALTSKSSVLTAIQMLWVNLLMDSLGALALATDLPTADLLQVPPERPGNPLITFLMASQIAVQSTLQLVLCLGVFYTKLIGRLTDELMLRTFVFNLFVFLQLFNELNCRSISGKWRRDLKQMFDFRNAMFWTIWIVTIALQIGIVEGGGRVFGTVGLSWKLWAASIGLALSSLPLAILVKFVVSRSGRSQVAEMIHPTREQLAWQSAIRGVSTHAKFYSAIRRKLDGAELTREPVDSFKSCEISPKSTDSLLLGE